MKRYEIEITPQAEKQMAEIRSYIANILLSQSAAQNLLSVLRREIQSLDYMPARIKLTSEEPWRSQGIRRMLVKKYYVYFWIDEDNNCIHVTSVTYAARNQREQLENMKL
ncbi:MAG: type II toxin-antitoxin system RelE/ParE family toxin [Oscillibacter sp.]|nr:type II toxin-antitoxin system RelE/ParE family toxin [Oscillibacter sp.]